MNFTDPLVLRSDVILVPVTDLSAEVRARFEYDEGDYTVSRMHGRVPSQIVDGETASLLKLFREPITIADAVIRNSRELEKDPRQWLDELLPHIDGFLRSHVLVPADAQEDERELRPLLESGSIVEGWTIGRCVHLMEESEIYRVRRDDVDGAMKISRGKYAFDNEEEVLRWLNGEVAPRLLDSGRHEDRAYFVVEWCEGADSTTAASFGRHDRVAMLALCTAVASAYAELHEHSVVHGDVHPRNVLVAPDRSRVRIIDFGLSQVKGHSTHRVDRGGMYAFYEPEYLAGIKKGYHLPASFAGEQYAVAALLYQLITGQHYVEFRLEREEMMRQAEEDPPLPFAARGIPPWPEVERILFRALEKDPVNRFASMREFADALRAAHMDDEALSAEARALVEEEIAQLSRGGAQFASGYPKPHASINYGAAGAAMGLLRIASVRNDPKVLALAEVWRSRAANYANVHDGWYDDEGEAPKKMLGEISPYHTSAGLYAASALLAHARNDRTMHRAATLAFIDQSQRPSDNLDLTLGRSGTLLAAALLRELGDEIETLGVAVARDLWKRFDALPPLREQPPDTYLGMAHGWSGYLYATLRWSLASNTKLPANAVARLEQLAELRIPRGRGAWWPRQLGGGLHDMMPGWCNGAAGHVFTWTAAYDATRDERWLAIAELAAWSAWEEPLHLGDLCCGSSGRAYALLNLYKHTGNREWLSRARSLANHAASAAHATAQRAHALWKGEMGIAALIADLESPENAAMPLFE